MVSNFRGGLLGKIGLFGWGGGRLVPTLPSQAFSWNPSVVTFESQAFNPKLKPSVPSFPLQNFSRDSSVATFCWQPLSSNTSLRSSWKSSVATVKSRVFCPKPLVETLQLQPICFNPLVTTIQSQPFSCNPFPSVPSVKL